MTPEWDSTSLASCRDALSTVKVDMLLRHQLTAVGVGVKVRGGHSTGEPCVKAFVVRKLPASQLAPAAMIPERLPGTDVLTDVDQSGVITAPPPGWPAPDSPTFSPGTVPSPAETACRDCGAWPARSPQNASILSMAAPCC